MMMSPSVNYHGMVVIIQQCIQISSIHDSEACDVKCKRYHHSGLALRFVSASKLSACTVVGK